MANLLYKFLGMFSLTDDYDDEDEDFDEDDYEEDDEEETPRFKSKKKEKSKRDDYVPEQPVKVEKKNNVLPYNRKAAKSSGMSVCVIKPNSLEDGREISDTLVSGRAVLLNLEDVDGDMAQRIIDFTSGACYSMGGNLQKVSTFIFVVTPSSVDIEGDFQDLISNATSSSSGMSGSLQQQMQMSNNRYRF